MGMTLDVPPIENNQELDSMSTAVKSKRTTTYRRPNLTESEYVLILQLAEMQVRSLIVGTPEFDIAYRLYIRLRDCKTINC